MMHLQAERRSNMSEQVVKRFRQPVDWVNLSAICAVLAAILIFPIYLGNKIDNNTIAFRSEMKEMRNEFQKDMKEVHEEMKDFQKAQQDYQARLCVLEDRYLRLREKESVRPDF